MRLCSLLICLLATAVCAAPTAGPQLGVKFSKRQNELPTLTLPYGTWRASEYNADADVRGSTDVAEGTADQQRTLGVCLQEH